MFDTLFSSWHAFRATLDDATEQSSFEAYSVFEDACLEVAHAGKLDVAAKASLKSMDIQDAGDFYFDMLSFASECDLDAMANGDPAMVSTRVFGIPALGEYAELAKLHGNSALVKSLRGSGLVQKNDIVILVGALPMDEAARMSPQALWNLAHEGAHVLSQVHHENFDPSQAYGLRNLLPVMADDKLNVGGLDFNMDISDSMGEDFDDGGETTIGSALLVGLRVHIVLAEEMASDEPMEDPLDEPSPEALQDWEEMATEAMKSMPLCAVMLPMPWRDSLVQSMATSAESQILMEGQGHSPVVDKMTIAPNDDGVTLTGYAEDGALLGQYRMPADVSFWALTELVAQFQGQGMDIELQPSSYVDLAAMPSPGKMLN